ncbi:polyamine ABC transporter substrate-binding protein [Prosthecomicrobium hirschii]|uniref:polyamine ABC transporter substrate-binding protein n=1 Tax=Prosthecodimorpha hirschii TaxID=665126 RepID=UPI002220BC12|nr:polyamine ABC transporter substrate-binding protein [Prosthecomicrobium hirschii]MCW1843821.1 polyamine ABC transporter substrate-binding protein [Prosthecomicrobium hirschii]
MKYHPRLLGLVGFAIAAVLSGGAEAQTKQVNIYNWSDYIDPSILEDFTKETGIKVKYDVFDSNDILETKLLAGKTGYDVVVPSAHFLGRQIQAGVFQKLDKSKLPNLTNMWPAVTERLAKYDPGNDYAVNYMWGTTGIGYNVKKIKERMPDAPLDSWALVFDPANAAKFKDCGIMMLDASDEIVPAVLNYLGLDPNTRNPDDFKKAAEHFKKIRPFVRKFHSSEYINALANGDVCLVVGWSGDIKQAGDRAEEKNAKTKDEKKKVEIGYSIPKGGAAMWFDNFSLPKDAKNIDEAHAFINYMMKPEVIAKASNFIKYPNGNLASQKLIDPAVLNDKNIYPADDVMAKLYQIQSYDPKTQRVLTDTWRDMKRK